MNNKDIKVDQIFNNFKEKQAEFIEDTGFKNVKNYLNKLEEIFKYIIAKIKIILTEINNLSQEYIKDILPYISPLIYNNDGKLFSNCFEIPKIKSLNYTNFSFDKISKDKAKNLFIPIINKENSKLQCCFKALNFIFGPFCSTFYKDPIKISLHSRLNEKLYAKIISKGIKENEESDEKNFDNKGIIPEDIQNLIVDKEINPGKNINLFIKIPSLLKEDDGKEKKYIYLGQLLLSTENEFPLALYVINQEKVIIKNYP